MIQFAENNGVNLTIVGMSGNTDRRIKRVYQNSHRRFSRVNKELLAEFGTVQDVEGELNSTFGNILPENIARMAVNEITNAPERQDWDRDWKELEIDTESDSDTKVHVDTKFIQQEANANWELTAQAARIPRSPPTPDEPRTKPG